MALEDELNELFHRFVPRLCHKRQFPSTVLILCEHTIAVMPYPED